MSSRETIGAQNAGLSVRPESTNRDGEHQTLRRRPDHRPNASRLPLQRSKHNVGVHETEAGVAERFGESADDAETQLLPERYCG